MNQYSSKDFSRVDSELSSESTERLIHKALSTSNEGSADGFSKERKHLVKIADLPSKTISMTLGGLSVGESTRKHRHSYETLLYIIRGKGKSIIDGQTVEWSQDDAVYIPVWAWHQHINLSESDDAAYIAVENTPLMQSLGVAVRQESDDR